MYFFFERLDTPQNPSMGQEKKAHENVPIVASVIEKVMNPRTYKNYYQTFSLNGQKA